VAGCVDVTVASQKGCGLGAPTDMPPAPVSESCVAYAAPKFSAAKWSATPTAIKNVRSGVFIMASKSSARFAVIKDKKPRCILSIAEMKDGTLIIHLRASHLTSDVAVPFGIGIENRGEPIKEYRYTVHMSAESKLGINTIKLHQDLVNGSSLTAVQYTSAIKQSNNFAALYARQCSAMDDPKLTSGAFVGMWRERIAQFCVSSIVRTRVARARCNRVRFKETETRSSQSCGHR
jgi:hypothetical protein